MGIPARVPRTPILKRVQQHKMPSTTRLLQAFSALVRVTFGGDSLLWRLLCIVVCLAAHSLVGSTHQMPVVPPQPPLGIAQVSWGAKSLWSSPGRMTVISRQYPRPMPCARSTRSSHCGQADRIPTRQKLSLILPSRTLQDKGDKPRQILRTPQLCGSAGFQQPRGTGWVVALGQEGTWLEMGELILIITVFKTKENFGSI